MSWSKTMPVKDTTYVQSLTVNQHSEVNAYPPKIVSSQVYNDAVNRVATLGENIPDWKERIKRGDDATTFLSSSFDCVHKLKPGHHYTSYKSSATRTVYEGLSGYPSAVGIYFPTAPSWSFLDSIDSDAKTIFVAKLRKKQRHLLSGVVLGELRETLKMVKHPLTSLRNGVQHYIDDLRRVRRGRGRTMKWRDFANYASGTWLEYAFGWSPLVSDITAASEAAASVIEGLRKDWVYVKSIMETSGPISSTTGGQNRGYAAIVWDRTLQSKGKVIYRGLLDLRSGVSPGAFREALGLTVSDIAETAYELIPWSFLLDYFTNAQSIVSAAAFNRTALRWCNKTSVTSSHAKYINHRHKDFSSYPSGWTIISSSLPDVHVENRSVLRDSYSGSLVPELDFTIPGFTQFLNIAALVGVGSIQDIFNGRHRR